MQKGYRYCFKSRALVPITVENDQNHVIPRRNIEIGNIQVNKNGRVRVETKMASVYSTFDSFFEGIPNKLIALNLTQDKYKTVFGILHELLMKSECLCAKISENSPDDKCASKAGFGHVMKKLKSIDTEYKLKKELKLHPMYVEPKELAIDLKWKKPKMNDETQISSHSLAQTTYQFVSPIKTLEACFSNEHFKNSYFEYNLEKKHECVPGVYQDFCCGSMCKSKKIFDDPLSLKIQIGTDDFEICCPLKSKAVIHKICGTHMQIRNMPLEYKAKLDNIYLVALCETSNIKPSDITYDFIARKIVEEMRHLEENGIIVGDKTIRGSISDVAADNLGANTISGYTECFVANYSCRHCECSKDECQVQTAEIQTKMRTRENYRRNVATAEGLQKPDLKRTKGIKRKCSFNELKYYHIIDNVSVDLMHDFNEGVISYALHDFFQNITEGRILTMGEIQSRIRDFSYSNVHKYNTPSLVSLEKSHLNQNATQFYCLMIHMPFIFHYIQQQILLYWEPIRTLLECMQIVYSETITECEIVMLERRVSEHLLSVQEVNKRSLTMKHHFMTHYPNSIRKMGTPVKSWTMLLEAKHKVFTEIAKSKKNFINVCLTMAKCHQERACKLPSLKAEIVTSVKYGDFVKTLEYNKYEYILAEELGSKSLTNLRVHSYIKYDNMKYEAGNFIIYNEYLCRIVHILSDGTKNWFICSVYNVTKRDEFCVSLIVEKTNENVIFDFERLRDKKVYYHIYEEGQVHVIANTLSVEHLLK